VPACASIAAAGLRVGRGRHGEQTEGSAADGCLDDDVGRGKNLLEIARKRAGNHLDLDLITYTAESIRERRGLGIADVGLDVVLSDEQSAGHLAGVAQADLGGSGPGGELGDPGAEPTAAPDVDACAVEGVDRSVVVAAGRDFGSLVRHAAPFDRDVFVDLGGSTSIVRPWCWAS
jgi:hypothetical protein